MIAQFAFPERIMVARVVVDGFVDATVMDQIALFITKQTEQTDRQDIRHWFFGNRASLFPPCGTSPQS